MTIHRRWSEEENDEFLHLIHVYQKDFQYIANEMNKTYNQVRSHYYNLNSKVELRRQFSKSASPTAEMHLIVSIKSLSEMFMNYLEFYLAVCGLDQKHYLRNHKSKFIETALQNDAQDQIWLLLKRSIVHSIFDVSSKEELQNSRYREHLRYI
ncbi:SANT/Myb_domain [Hexamita inflata]|uniref:SANT/Myb domain n=1 Tax=Hexamita inflata TaxID=28002 RepID=A0AA86PT32_9EUKA|nr:SANT/Myb domain [Hexamita inflata]